MLGRQLARPQIGMVGLIEPGEKDAQILAIVPLRVVGEAFLDLAIVQKGQKVT